MKKMTKKTPAQVTLLAAACTHLLMLPSMGTSAERPEMEQVIVTATKTPKKLENVAAVVTVIDQEEIQSLPARTVGDLLADLPGFQATEPQGSGVVTPQKTLMRGNGFAGHTLVLLDGQRINTPSTDYAYLTTISTHAIDRIEIIRGPFSALYGSSGASGIINIITKDGGDRSYVQLHGRAGDFDRGDFGVNAGVVQNDFSLGIFSDYRTVGNYYLYEDMGIDTSNREYDHARLHIKMTNKIGEDT
ncbi:MAG: hypothetical protein D3909_11500 [Candidatus Electrothrix sp. ATG1]|nr:hypothetical protein [Candidatus Electrothrix sp. ATG1]